MPSKRTRKGGNPSVASASHYVCNKDDCRPYLHKTLTKNTCFLDSTLTALLVSTVMREHIKDKLRTYMIERQFGTNAELYDLFRETISLGSPSWLEILRMHLKAHAIQEDIDVRRFLLFKLVFFNCFDKNIFQDSDLNPSVSNQYYTKVGTPNETFSKELCRTHYRTYKMVIYGDLAIVKLPFIDQKVSLANSWKSLKILLELFGFKKNEDYVVLDFDKMDKPQTPRMGLKTHPRFIVAKPNETLFENINRSLQRTSSRLILPTDLHYANQRYVLQCGTLFKPIKQSASITTYGHFEGFAKCGDTYYHLDDYRPYESIYDVVNLMSDEKDKILKLIPNETNDVDLRFKRYFSWVIYAADNH